MGPAILRTSTKGDKGVRLAILAIHSCFMIMNLSPAKAGWESLGGCDPRAALSAFTCPGLLVYRCYAAHWPHPRGSSYLPLPLGEGRGEGLLGVDLN